MSFEDLVTGSIEAQKWDEVVEMCSEHELELGSQGLNPGEDFHIQYLLALYITGDLVCARYLWKRIDGKTINLSNVWEVGTYLWKREYGNAVRKLEDTVWPEACGASIAALKSTIIKRVVDIVGKSYSKLSTDQLSSLTGLPATEVREVAAKQGWTVDAQSGSIAPVRRTKAQTSRIGIEQLDQLSNYVIFMDSGR